MLRLASGSVAADSLPLTLLVLVILLGSASCQVSGNPPRPDVAPASPPASGRFDTARQNDPAPTAKIRLSDSDLSLRLGAHRPLRVTITAADGTTTDWTAAATWKTEPAGILEVDSGSPARLRAVAEGTCQLTATVESWPGGPLSVSTSAEVVSRWITKLEVEGPREIMAPGQSAEIRVFGVYSDESRVDVTDRASWHSARAGVAAFSGPSAAKTLQAGAKGVTTIHAELGELSSPGFGVLVANIDDLPRALPGTGPDASAPAATSPLATTGPKAIARWNVVPYRTFVGDFLVGVVAFHKDQIDRVEVSANGGPWAVSRAMLFNPRTSTWEYFVNVRASDFPEGPVSLRAIAYPKAGAPRVLDPLPLFARQGGRVSSGAVFVAVGGSDGSGDGSRTQPFQTIAGAAAALQRSGKADGGTIYLEAGAYDLGNGKGRGPATPRRYLTVRPAPGVARENAVLRSCGKGGLGTHRLHLKGLTIRTAITNRRSLKGYLWIDDCLLEGSGRWREVGSAGFVAPSTWGGSFVTDCHFTRNKDGLIGIDLARNVRVTEIGRDSFKNVVMLVNGSVEGIDHGETKWHPDVHQYTGPIENAITFGLRATNLAAQGVFIKFKKASLRNAAFVNVLLESDGYLSQIKVPCEHVLLWHCTFANQKFNWKAPATPQTKDLSIRNCVFDALWGRPPANSVNNCHFGSSPPAEATESTSGLIGFNHPEDDNYSPSDTSPLRERVTELFVPVDGYGHMLTTPAAIGAHQR